MPLFGESAERSHASMLVICHGGDTHLNFYEVGDGGGKSAFGGWVSKNVLVGWGGKNIFRDG